MVRRALFGADLLGIVAALYLGSALFPPGPGGTIASSGELLLFAATLPVWFLLLSLHGLYGGDGERGDHSTVDDFFGVVHVMTLGVWIIAILAQVTGLASPAVSRLAVFWALAIILVTSGRVIARAVCRRRKAYIQRVVVVGEGDIGQLVARKIKQHPEYGLDLLGFIDGDPKGKRTDINGISTLGGLERLGSIVADRNVDRVIVAFSREPDAATMEVIRDLRDGEITVDVVPRLFDLVGLRATVHTLEGLALVCVPPGRLSRSSLLIKRLIDIAGASVLLILALPFFAYVALRIRLDSPGPVFFRQTRLGLGKSHFTAYKFRTMKVDTCQDEHRSYVRSISDASATVGGNGVYKLDRDDAVTPVGRWLRKTSLDELPQLINVLRGEMSLVGPRPCIPYETENFKPHHEDRFLVPQGMTGLWQVTARANSTFGEALDMDVAYVHAWSIGLDVRLLLLTPLALVRQRLATT